jgi:hypothetical protein
MQTTPFMEGLDSIREKLVSNLDNRKIWKI